MESRFQNLSRAESYARTLNHSRFKNGLNRVQESTLAKLLYHHPPSLSKLESHLIMSPETHTEHIGAILSHIHGAGFHAEELGKAGELFHTVLENPDFPTLYQTIYADNIDFIHSNFSKISTAQSRQLAKLLSAGFHRHVLEAAFQRENTRSEIMRLVDSLNLPKPRNADEFKASADLAQELKTLWDKHMHKLK